MVAGSCTVSFYDNQGCTSRDRTLANLANISSLEQPGVPSTARRSMSLPTASLWREIAALSRSENSLKLAAQMLEDLGKYGDPTGVFGRNPEMKNADPTGFFKKCSSHSEMQSPF